MERILVRAPNWLGDVILSLGALRDIKRNFPTARLEVMARPSVAEVYGAVGEVEAVRLSHGLRLDVALMRAQFDLALLFPNSFASALTVFLARIPERWGYAADGRAALLTRVARVPDGLRGSSEVYYYRAMLSGLGLSVSVAPNTSLECPSEWRARGQEALGGEGPFVGVAAGAAFGAAKRWIPERYAAVADRLARQTGCRIAILGSAAERGLGERIASGMQHSARVLCGRTTLTDLMGVLAALRLLLTNDSGTMHLASALGVPLVAVFGPTDWRETAPRGERSRVVRESVSCAPCKLRDCPVDHACMRKVTIDRVADEALALLEGHA